MSLTSRRSLIAAGLLVLLVLAVGLAAQWWSDASRLPSAGADPLALPSVALATVLVAGLADGINPCAFTVLLLFVAAVSATYGRVDATNAGALRLRLALVGGAFILAIFATYLALGVGLLQVTGGLTQDHLGTRLGAVGAVLLGLWMLKDALAPGWGPKLAAPARLGRMVHVWGQRATVTGMFGLGALVALCTVPCSGAVYLGVVSLLSLQESFVRAYAYLVLYNIMFVLPLVGILAAASARPTLNRLAHWNHRHGDRVRLALGGGVVLLGLGILAAV